MKRSIAALAVAIGVVGGAVSAWPGPATASHDDCTVSANAPLLWRNFFVQAYAEVGCVTTKNTIRQSYVLTRDGIEVDRADYTCHKQAGCWSFVSANDVEGDQVWCAHYSVRIGPHSFGTITRCEADTF